MFFFQFSAHVKSMEIKSKDPLPNNFLKTEKNWLVTLYFLCAEYTNKCRGLKWMIIRHHNEILV